MTAARDGAADARSPGGHLGDLVTDLVDGRLEGADPGLVLQHLQRCSACRDDLADAVVVAAALRGVTGVSVVGHDDRRTTPTHVAVPPPGAHRRSRALVGVATAAVLTALIGGVLGGVAIGRRTDTGGAAANPVAAAPVTVLLQADGRTRGAAVVTGSGSTRRMTIDAELDASPAGTVLTVWLRAAGQPNQRVGTLDVAGRGSFVMSAATAARYSTVVLSDQPVAAASLDPATVVATADLT